MRQPILLSDCGSDRATAYHTSNKIVRHRGSIYVGWLDAPKAEQHLVKNRLAICDAGSSALKGIVTLGAAYDNHCGPALAMGRDETLHAIIGAHHHPFLHRWSTSPDSEKCWSAPLALGPFATYPSLIADRDGTLHLIHRHMDERWQLWHRRKPLGKPWGPWSVLAVGPLPGYNHFLQSLTLGPGGALHLLFAFSYTRTGKSKDVSCHSVNHLRSEDGGLTWYNEGERCQLPLTIETARPILHLPEGGLNIGNHVVDHQDRPWFFLTGPEHPGGALLQRSDSGWEVVASAFGGQSFVTAREASISRDAAGRIHLIIATNPDGGPAGWYDPRHTLFHAIIPEAGGGLQSFKQLLPGTTGRASWLPSLEQWDWARSAESCPDAPYLVFTEGMASGRGENNNSNKTKVLLTKLPEG